MAQARTAASERQDPPMTDEAATAETRAAWDRLATGYDSEVTGTHFEIGEEGLRRAGLAPGMRFLDVAAGSGALSIPAARLGAEVVATDLSPAMLDRLAARAAREGLAIETRAMDGQALQFADASFDVAGSQFGVMLFPDMPRGVRELARVVRPGGCVLLTALGDPRRLGFIDAFVRAIKSVRPGFDGPPLDPLPLPFQLHDPERVRSELTRAGLGDVEVATSTETLRFRTGAELWAWLTTSNPFCEGLLAELAVTDAERRTMEQALERLVRERADADGVASLPSPINIGTGTR